MEHIYEAVKNHLTMKTSGALLLTGDWGSGKTYHVKNKIFPKIKKDTDYTPIIVSLFGVSTRVEIAQKVLFAYFDKGGKKINLSSGAFVKNVTKLSKAFPKLNEYLDIEKLITGAGDNIFRFLNHEKLLICFDDLERISDDLKVDDFMGAVNELVENLGSKVLIIANESEIKKGFNFKEKSVEKTIHFIPDLSAILDSLFSLYPKGSFSNYLKENKKFILETLSVKNIENEEQRKDQEKTFSNIRTIKFAIEHFKVPYLIIEKEKDISEELTKQQLKNIWFFCLAISCEFRKPKNITFRDRKKLDTETRSIADIDLSLFDLGNNPPEEEPVENDWTYSNNFKSIYYNRLSENFIYYPELYDLITSSKEVSGTNLLENLEKSYHVTEGKIHPAYELLNGYIHGFWKFSDEEFRERLNSLFGYVEKGEYQDIVSYLNSGVYLLGFVELFDKTIEEINEALKQGLIVLFEQVEMNYMMVTQFEMSASSFTGNENLNNLIPFIWEKIEEQKQKNAVAKSEELSNMLDNDVETFVKEFLPGDGSIRMSEEPIFHELDQEKVKKSVSKWNGEEIMNITSLLKTRYLDTGLSDRLVDELTFLQSLKEGISLLNLEEDKTLSNYMIGSELSPMIEKCEEKLTQYRNAQQQI